MSFEAPSPTVCHAEACAIQDCLKRANYNESRCTAAIDALYSCCKKMYDENPSARAIACMKPELLELKMDQRRRESVDAKLHQPRR
ncbi:Cx9C motif-containing protein 4, mitochondrial [Myxozyma melibiosi]|uniref:Cx9C motif-containing protein 4, mitochondrial n=1 Tax=Myxozyma melibiosi TaxID=54550 RepID=A0ABR1EY77_9ASCO